MKYNVGDEICLRAKITSVHKDANYPYYINICIGDTNWICDEYACQESAIVNLASGFNEDKIADALGKCSCLHEEYGKQVCYGTKEREECSCEGDPNKCNFYPEKRNNTRYMIADTTEKGTIVTADLYRTTLEKISYMDYGDILTEFDIPEYGDVRNREEAIVYLIKTRTPKEVVEIYEDYDYRNILYTNYVIENESNGKQYLVTKIFNNIVYMIAIDGETRSEDVSIMKKDKYKKIDRNMTIQEFFSKEV